MFEYYALLWSRYKIPIFPIVLYLHGGDTGTSQEEYLVRLFGREVLRCGYESVRLERLYTPSRTRKRILLGFQFASSAIA